MVVLSVQRLNGKVLASLFFASICIAACFGNSLEEQPSNEEPEVQKLSYCGEEEPNAEVSKRLLYVSTLDGRLSALDLSQNGELKWSIETGDSLLSSSIHRLELTNQGKWVRLIPSLAGNLFKFDGSTIEAVPLTAEDLLKSSFKFSDEIVISGGREARTYGVSTRTGTIIYECSMHGCTNYTDSSTDTSLHNSLLDDVLIVRRQTQTVRAVDPRSGVERWNFSIGNHDLELMQSKDCQSNEISSELTKALLDLEIKIIVPDGMICVFSKSNPNNMLWHYKFDFPIVSAWRSDGGENIESIDFFNGADWLWNGQRVFYAEENDEKPSPSIYLGMYEKQPYIQESRELLKVAHEKYQYSSRLITDETNFPKIPWKPYPATTSGLKLIEDHSRDVRETSESTSTDPPSNPIATSVLYASEYVNGNGFYFYTTEDSSKTERAICDRENASREEERINEEEEVYYSFAMPNVHLWHYWKEILAISLTTAFILNVILNTRPGNDRMQEYVIVERHVPVAFAKEAIEEDYSKSHSSNRSFSESNSGENFQSRFQSDFEVVQLLGHGGFGVVFRVRNKIDMREYAIKRQILPTKQESRERVMREVKTLANCEHQNIVRYFHAWIETPPPGWQEMHDRQLREKEILSTSIDIEPPSETSSALPSGVVGPAKALPPPPSATWLLNFDKKNNFSMSSLGAPAKCGQDDDTSGIEFAAPENEEEEEEDSHIIFEKHSDQSSNHVISIGTNTSTTTTNSSVGELRSRRNGMLVPLKTHKRHVSVDLDTTEDIELPSAAQANRRNLLYILTELCRKDSLRDWLRRTTYEERADQVVPIFEQIVGAVEYVHLKGLIHRDLKPSNIFFALDGQIKIGDFGLVTDSFDEAACGDEGDRIAGRSIGHTQKVGTHLYMSPEQKAGQKYGYKVDIYSLGLILFELLVTFSTEMERIDTLKAVRERKFPEEFQVKFKDEFELLQIMLADNPVERPTTFGIRARPPLRHEVANLDWHFELPPRRRNSRTISQSSGELKAYA